MMYEDDGQWKEQKEASQGIRSKIGIVLIVIGGLISLYLFKLSKQICDDFPGGFLFNLVRR